MISVNLMNLRTALFHLDEEGTVAFNKLREGKDGLARCGTMDSNEFVLWSTLMPYVSMVPYAGPLLKNIGPTFVIMNRAAFAHFIQSLDKNADYAGNPSVAVIRKQVSDHTIFSTTDRASHGRKREIIKHDFVRIDRCRIEEKVKTWIARMPRNADLNVHDWVTSLVADVFATFIGHTTANATLLRCVSEFQDGASTFGTSSSFESAAFYKGLLCHNPAMEEDDVLTLIKVGFGNIHSMMTSMIRRLASSFEKVRQAIGSDKVSLDLNSASAANRFFVACYALAPPVWIMGRKVGDAPMVVHDVTLPPHTLMLVPWFHLLRAQYGSAFDMDRFTEQDVKTIAPFSVGANSCIGRYLATPLLECVLEQLLQNKIRLISASDEYEGKVFLKQKVSPIICIE